MCLLYKTLSLSLSLSLLSSMSSLSYYLSLQPKRQKPFLPQNIWCIKHPPNSSFHEIYIVIAACFSSMLYFLPLPPNQTLSLSLFPSSSTSMNLWRWSIPSLQSLATDGSLKARRKADALLRLQNSCCFQSHHQIFCLSLSCPWHGNCSAIAASLHRHNIPSNSF